MGAKLSHERAFELLPWLVNETLHGDEREQVEQHLRDCLICRKELGSQHALAATVKDQPTLDWSVEQNFDALLRRIDTAAARSSTRYHRWRTLLASPALLAGASATAVAIIVVAAWLGRAGTEAESFGSYSTLAQPSSSVLVDVIFSPGTSETQMRALLQELGATIVAGPSELGRYTIRVDGAEPRDVDMLVAELRGDPRVRFAGPSFASDPAGAER